MADPSVFQIMKSNAVLWMSATLGAAEPDVDTILAGAAWGGTWVRLGATQAPLTCLYEDERADINVEENLAPVFRYKTSESLTLETVLAELDADYIALLTEGTVSVDAGGGATIAYDELPVGNRSLLTMYQFGFEGIQPQSDAALWPVRFIVPRATIKFGGEMSFSKREDDYTGVPITIEALAPTDLAVDKLFKMQQMKSIA